MIDVNTGKNVGKTNLEETVFRNNLEAAEEVSRQLRLRDIGGIIVIDFIDMEIPGELLQGRGFASVRPGAGQDPHPGLRHLRAGPRGDDPQAGLRGLMESFSPCVRCAAGVDRLRRLGGLSQTDVAGHPRRIGAVAQACYRVALMYAVIRCRRQAGASPRDRAAVSPSSYCMRPLGQDVTFRPVLLVDGQTQSVATPRNSPGAVAVRQGPRRVAGTEDRRIHLQAEVPPQPPAFRSPPALHQGADHCHRFRARRQQGRRRSQLGKGRRPPFRGQRRRHDVQDQGRGLDPQRARLERGAPRREGVRRHLSARRRDHRPPARYPFPSRSQCRPAAATTRSSPPPRAA